MAAAMQGGIITGDNFTCVSCGYDLRGHLAEPERIGADAVCPECGEPISASDPQVLQVRFEQEYLPIFWSGVRLLLITHIFLVIGVAVSIVLTVKFDAWQVGPIVLVLGAAGSVVAMQRIVRQDALLEREISC